MAHSCSFALMISIFLSSFATTSLTIDSATAIYDQIFQNYKKSVRPTKNSSIATSITFEIQYLIILGMNSAQESIDINIDYKMTWTDEHLTWRPSDFADPVESLVVLQSEIWQPDITLYHLLESTPLIPDDKRKARVDSNGRVTVYNPQIMTVSCTMKIELFPFDSQYCSMGFGPWIYRENEQTTESINSSIADFSSIRGNSEWSIVAFQAADSSYSDMTGTYTSIYFDLIIKRNPVYYVCVLIVPTLIIITLCLLGIFAPSSSSGEREEKVNLGLTTLLTVAVILSLVAGEMPKATSLPLLGLFVLAELIICSFATLVSILIIFFHQHVVRHHTLPPKWLQDWVFHRSNMRMNTAANQNIDEKNNAVVAIGRNKILEFQSFPTKINYRIEKEENDVELTEQWKRILDYFDLICLTTFLLIQAIVSNKRSSAWILAFCAVFGSRFSDFNFSFITISLFSASMLEPWLSSTTYGLISVVFMSVFIVIFFCYEKILFTRDSKFVGSGTNSTDRIRRDKN